MVQTAAMYPQCLGEYIRTHSAPKKVFCDNAKAETSDATKRFTRTSALQMEIQSHTNQNQNAAEREIQDLKKAMMLLMNITNTPKICGLFALNMSAL
jgi:hypothetical protein